VSNVPQRPLHLAVSAPLLALLPQSLSGQGPQSVCKLTNAAPPSVRGFDVLNFELFVSYDTDSFSPLVIIKPINATRCRVLARLQRALAKLALQLRRARPDPRTLGDAYLALLRACSSLSRPLRPRTSRGLGSEGRSKSMLRSQARRTEIQG
jgi:hypothetical protein